jgi:long-chain acyl-CoA synthetase
VAACNSKLAQHQRIGTVSWWPEGDFPRTPTLKVRRHLLPLPEALEPGRTETVPAANDVVAQVVAQAARVGAAQPEQSLGELGLDSLGLAALAEALTARTGKIVADSDLRLDMTVAELATFLVSAPESDAEVRAAQRDGPEPVSAERAPWPYTWGRRLRPLSLPMDVIYGLSVTKTIVLGAEHLADLPPPPRVIFAGTHHSFLDMPLVRHALWYSPARPLVRRLVIAAAADGFARYPLHHWWGILAFGLYPLHQDRERELSLRGIVRLAQAGNAVLIFPQGVHAEPDQERAGDPAVRFRPGVALLAEALDAAVVPFGLAGTEEMIPATLEGFQGQVIGGVPAQIRRGPLAIGWSAPVRLQPNESPDAFAARLEAVCYPLTRLAERAIAAERTRAASRSGVART